MFRFPVLFAESVLSLLKGLTGPQVTTCLDVGLDLEGHFLGSLVVLARHGCHLLSIVDAMRHATT